MVFGIWGRDGTGKSTLADALGVLFAKRGIAIVIDTDLTQPTLPARIGGRAVDGETSLGRAISDVGVEDAAAFLHQHSKHKNLFYAGLTDREDCLSYEIGLEAGERALEFVQLCASLLDTVIVDVSSQRTDPFVPAVLTKADLLLLPVTPNVQGVCWLNSVKPLIDSIGNWNKIAPVAAMADKHHDLKAIEKAAGISFAAVLPFAKELGQIQDTGKTALDGATPAAIRYIAEAQKLYMLAKGDGKA